MFWHFSPFHQIHLPRDRTPCHKHMILCIILDIMGAHAYIFQCLGMDIPFRHLLKYHQTVVFCVINNEQSSIRSDRMCVMHFIGQYIPLVQRVHDIIMIDDLVVIAVRNKIHPVYPRDIRRHIQDIICIFLLTCHRIR